MSRSRGRHSPAPRRQRGCRACLTAIVVLGLLAAVGGVVLAVLNFPTEKLCRSTDATVVGHLAWDITDCQTGKTIGRGNKSVALSDFTIKSRHSLLGGAFYDKRIDLEQGYYLAMSEFPAKSASAVTGFGMVGGKDGANTFCWEWFEVAEASTHARKLQESGTLGIAINRVGSCYEVAQTEFLSPISFRLKDRDASPPSRKPRWRVNIHRGSKIDWPAVVRGKVVPAE